MLGTFPLLSFGCRYGGVCIACCHTAVLQYYASQTVGCRGRKSALPNLAAIKTVHDILCSLEFSILANDALACNFRISHSGLKSQCRTQVRSHDSHSGMTSTTVTPRA